MNSEPGYIGVAELASRISLSPRTIRSLVRDPVRPLPAVRVRKKLLFNVAAVEAYMEAHRVSVPDVSSIVDRIIKGSSEENEK